ncbi:DNA primase [Candidatus Poribacteria bacterium]|nr:DNA primase [Candidatus Poribacteria bacterium]
MRARSFNHIPPEIIDEVRQRNDIAEVIMECGIPLKLAGKNYKACCPFHDEKTPSFTVSSERQMFYCFGCQVGGNTITFLQKYENKPFIESIEWLANRVGVPLPTQDQKSKEQAKKRLNLEELNRLATKYFHRNLLDSKIGTKASIYLKNRQVSNSSIRAFQIGYATRGSKDLLENAIRKGSSKQQLLDVGLIKDNENGTTDRFWDRVIFPIIDERGIPVAFGGRVLSPDVFPKYLNTASTVLYDKSKTLYNLYGAKSAMQKTRQAILVEGYFDVIRLSQEGVKNTVASLGTSFSKSHASLLKRFVDEVFIVFDGDSAGIRATVRGLNHLVKEGLKVRVMMLPDGQDPDTFVLHHGVEAFNERLAAAMNLVEFQIRRAVETGGLRQIDVKTQVLKDIADTLSNIKSRIELDQYINYTAQELDLDRAIIWQELRALGVKPPQSNKSKIKTKPNKTSLNPRHSIEQQLMEVLFQNPDFISIAKESFSFDDFKHPIFSEIAKVLWKVTEAKDNISIQDLVDECNNEEIQNIVSSFALTENNVPNPKIRLEGCLKKLNQFVLLDLERDIRTTALAEGQDDVKTLMELVELSKRRKQFNL